jgi:hypothetical protein
LQLIAAKSFDLYLAAAKALSKLFVFATDCYENNSHRKQHDPDAHDEKIVARSEEVGSGHCDRSENHQKNTRQFHCTNLYQENTRVSRGEKIADYRWAWI